MVTSVLVAAFAVVAVGPPAQAHGGQSADEGYVIVQQALTYLVDESGKAGTTEALMKVDAALAAKDQDGVAIAKVRQAKTALQAGDSAAARVLLQDSISEAVNALKPAVGNQTGTKTVLNPFPSRGPFSLTEGMILALSVLVLAAGVVLAVRFRPREGLRELGRDISGVKGLRHEGPEATSTGRK